MLDLSLLQQLQNKRIVVLGLGLTGMSFVRFLANNKLSCVVNDSRERHAGFTEFNQQYPEIELHTGTWHSELIQSADILLVSPGVDITLPAIADHISDTCQVWGDIELYARLTNEASHTPCVAVTGSNGKSTVVNLVHHMGQALGVNIQLGGNVGVPVLDTLDGQQTEAPKENAPQEKASELLVLELSSFQLETIKSLTPQVACILNLSDDHLDRHKTMAIYGELKQRIYQGAEFAVFNCDDEETRPTIEVESTSFTQHQPQANQFGITNHQGQNYLAYGDELLLAVTKLPIAGLHNATNCLAALAIW